MLRRCCGRSMNQHLFLRRMKISNSHNFTTTTTTTIIIIMVGAGMGPSSWCLDIVTTITTTTITASIVATIDQSRKALEKQDPRVLFFLCWLFQAAFLLRRAMKMPVSPVKHGIAR